MDTNGKVNITSNLLSNMEKTTGLIDLPSKESFLDILKLDKVIIYLLVEWSGPERVSRAIVFNVLNELDRKNTPVFKIDCSDQKKEWFIDWLIEQRQEKNDLYHGGWGETLLIEKGIITDFIKNPGRLGLDKTKDKLKEWLNAQ